MSPRHALARFAGIALAIALIAASVGAPVNRARAQGDPLRVVATFSILADWVRNVGGEHVDITTIVPAGGDAHTFDPDPSQVASIADADIIFAIGPGFEPWLADMMDASGTSATYVEVATGIALPDDEAHEEDDHGHDHGDTDPHIWGDVANAIRAVETIRDSLIAADGTHADTYREGAEAYIAQLKELDTSIRERVATIPEDNRNLVTTHDTFRYYAHAYGFEILGTALGSLSTEAGDPSAREIAMLVESIRETGVPAIFTENVVNPALMEAVAAEAGVELAPPLYTDALGEPGSEGETYIAMMTYNTETIVAALGGE